MLKQLWATITEFLNDVQLELKKVSYPTRSATMGSTMVVIVLVVIVSLFLFGTDQFLAWLLRRII